MRKRMAPAPGGARTSASIGSWRRPKECCNGEGLTSSVVDSLRFLAMVGRGRHCEFSSKSSIIMDENLGGTTGAVRVVGHFHGGKTWHNSNTTRGFVTTSTTHDQRQEHSLSMRGMMGPQTSSAPPIILEDPGCAAGQPERIQAALQVAERLTQVVLDTCQQQDPLAFLQHHRETLDSLLRARPPASSSSSLTSTSSSSDISTFRLVQQRCACTMIKVLTLSSYSNGNGNGPRIKRRGPAPVPCRSTGTPSSWAPAEDIEAILSLCTRRRVWHQCLQSYAQLGRLDDALRLFAKYVDVEPLPLSSGGGSATTPTPATTSPSNETPLASLLRELQLQKTDWEKAHEEKVASTRCNQILQSQNQKPKTLTPNTSSREEKTKEKPGTSRLPGEEDAPALVKKAPRTANRKTPLFSPDVASLNHLLNACDKALHLPLADKAEPVHDGTSTSAAGTGMICSTSLPYATEEVEDEVGSASCILAQQDHRGREKKAPQIALRLFRAFTSIPSTLQPTESTYVTLLATLSSAHQLRDVWVLLSRTVTWGKATTAMCNAALRGVRTANADALREMLGAMSDLEVSHVGLGSHVEPELSAAQLAWPGGEAAEALTEDRRGAAHHHNQHGLPFGQPSSGGAPSAFGGQQGGSASSSSSAGGGAAAGSGNHGGNQIVAESIKARVGNLLPQADLGDRAAVEGGGCRPLEGGGRLREEVAARFAAAMDGHGIVREERTHNAILPCLSAGGAREYFRKAIERASASNYCHFVMVLAKSCLQPNESFGSPNLETRAEQILAEIESLLEQEMRPRKFAVSLQVVTQYLAVFQFLRPWEEVELCLKKYLFQIRQSGAPSSEKIEIPVPSFSSSQNKLLHADAALFVPLFARCPDPEALLLTMRQTYGCAPSLVSVNAALTALLHRRSYRKVLTLYSRLPRAVANANRTGRHLALQACLKLLVVEQEQEPAAATGAGAAKDTSRSRIVQFALREVFANTARKTYETFDVMLDILLHACGRFHVEVKNKCSGDQHEQDVVVPRDYRDFSDSFLEWESSAGEDSHDDDQRIVPRPSRTGHTFTKQLLMVYAEAVRARFFPGPSAVSEEELQLDLHRYSRQLAVFAVWNVLREKRFLSQLSKPSCGEIVFVVGRGSHNKDGVPHLRLAVEAFLHEFQDLLSWDFPNAGRIRVFRKS